MVRKDGPGGTTCKATWYHGDMFTLDAHFLTKQICGKFITI